MTYTHTQSAERDIALIDELLAHEGECPWLEFKENNANKEMIGKLCSALSNAARIHNKDMAYVLWGVEDESKRIVGTSYTPESEKVGNQVFTFWLSQHLNHCDAFNFKTVQHPQGKLVLLEIPAATTAPAEFDNIAYVRIGSATPRLSAHPQLFQKLIDNMRPYTWEKGIAKSFLLPEDVFSLLDYPTYLRLTKHPLPENRNSLLEVFEAERLLTKDVGGRWNITNLGALLLANDLRQFDPSLARKGIRFVAYEGNNKASTVVHRYDEMKGYASGFEAVLAYIKHLIPQNEYIGQALREARPLFPELAVREIIVNALIHQDFTIRGTGPLIELFKTRLEVTNPGAPLIQVDRMIDLPPRSRNEVLASIMRRMGFCEEQGSGLDKVVELIESLQLPAPLFEDAEEHTRVVLFAPMQLTKMNKDDRIRACYLHACLQFLERKHLTNASLRQRFGIEEKNKAIISRYIREAIDAGMISPVKADAARNMMKYNPYWAM